MKKEIGFILGGIFLFSLVLVGVVMVQAAETATSTATATVTVNTFVDISIVSCAGGIASSINYGGQDPNTADVQPVNCQNSTDGDLKVTVEETTNKAVTVQISGTDYVGPDPSVIVVGQTEYAEDSAKTSPVALSVTPTIVWSSMGGTGIAVSDDLWFWLDIPNEFLKAGEYPSTYTIGAS